MTKFEVIKIVNKQCVKADFFGKSIYLFFVFFSFWRLKRQKSFKNTLKSHLPIKLLTSTGRKRKLKKFKRKETWECWAITQIKIKSMNGIKLALA